MQNKAKRITISTALLSILFVSFLGFFVANAVGQEEETEDVFIYATSDPPVDMDPANAWDSASSDVLENVLEGLVKYDVSVSSMPIVPCLATSWSWNTAVTELTMNLRTGVKFHNNDTFNATAVKWNFDRIYGLIHAGISQLGELFIVAGEDIVEEVTIVNEYQVKFTLSFPFSPFLDLLTFYGCSILAPGTAELDALLQYGNITTNGDQMIGTGPFAFKNITTDSLNLVANKQYWGGAPAMERVVFNFINDATTRNTAMLNKECTFLADPLPTMKATFANDSELHMQDGPTQLVIQYIGMNNRAYNVTIREASARAFNYTYALEQIMQNNGVRLHGPIPNGMRFYDSSVGYAVQDYTTARQVLIDAGLAPAAQLNNNTYWTDRADSLHGLVPIASVNFTYNIGNAIRDQMGTLLQSSLKPIGISCTKAGLAWADYLDRIYNRIPNGRNMLGYFFIGWGPDYNDPDNFISPLFSNTSESNEAQVNDPDIQGWLTQAKQTADNALRATLYHNIQERLQTVLYPWIFVYQGWNLDVWMANLQGYYPNAMDKHLFGTAWFGFPGAAIPIPTFGIVMAMFGAISLLTVSVSKKLRKRM